MNKWFDSQSKIVRIILLIPIWGWIFAGLYRIFKYVNGSKNTVTLVFGVLFIVLGKMINKNQQKDDRI